MKNYKFTLFSDVSYKNIFNGALQGRYVVIIKSDDSQFATHMIWWLKKLKQIVRSTVPYLQKLIHSLKLSTTASSFAECHCSF